MSKVVRFAGAAIVAPLSLCLAGSARGQEAAAHAKVVNPADMKLAKFPGLPTCATGSVLSGDPAKGPSIIFSRLAAGCSFPWHWHTPNEHLMLVSGTGRLEMKDGKRTALKPGGFAMMPSRHVHQFGCGGPCSLYVYSDSAFDIHYVDEQGKEIPLEEAVKAVKKAPATRSR
jgi:quercetin dioxygenase-like cupin family protein